MSWSVPKTWVTAELATAALLNTHIRDNFNEVRAGGLAISGQAAYRIPYASSATQLATSAGLAYSEVTSQNRMAVTQSASSTIAMAAFDLFAGTTTASFQAFSQGYTTSSQFIAASALLYNNGAGGLVYDADNAGGMHRWFHSATEVMRIDTSNALNIYSGALYVGATQSEVSIFGITGSPYQIVLNSDPFGTGNKTGNSVVVGYNTSGNGAAGSLNLIGKGGGNNYVWADASAAPGMLRISTAPPDEDGTPSDTSGTIVGTQTSSLDTKDVLGEGIAPSDALAAILATPVKHFRYKGGSYSGTTFHGIIADSSPEFAMDPDEAHPHGRSFNPVSAFGYSVQAFKALHARIAALEAR